MAPQRGAGRGAERRHAEAIRAIKPFITASETATTTIERHVIDRVRHAAAIARLVGFTVTGFDVVVENGTVRHTLRRHGDRAVESRRGQLPITADDLNRLPRILLDFDAAEPAEATKQGTPQVRLRKQLDAVDYEVFVELRRSARQMAFKTMMKRQTRRTPP